MGLEIGIWVYGQIKAKGRDEIIQEKVQIEYWKEQGFALRKFKKYSCRRGKSFLQKKVAKETMGKPGACDVRKAPPEMFEK